MKDGRSYFSLLGGFSPTCTLKVRDLNNSQTNDEYQRDRQNPLLHKCRQRQHEPDGSVYLPAQDDQAL